MTEERSESAAGLSFKMGEALLRNGAEIFRVQETMERVARAYDIEEYDVYVLSNAIFANAVENGEKIDTKLKFVDYCKGRLLETLLKPLSRQQVCKLLCR